MDLLLLTLLAWIDSKTEYSTVSAPHPTIVEMTHRQLTAEYYSGAPHLAPDKGVDNRLNALYSPNDGKSGTIYIRKASTITGADDYETAYDNPLFQEILLHELVHHAQRMSGASEHWNCRHQGEKEAYLLGGQYLYEKKIQDPIPNRKLWAEMYSRC